MYTVLLVVALLVMIIGFIGVFIPAVPGVGLIFIAALGYGLVTHFDDINGVTLIVLGLLTGLSMILDVGASMITTKKLGASKLGLLGALVGGLIGFIVFNILGLIIGQMLGAILGELLIKSEIKKSLKIGFATLVGYILGIVGNSTIAIIMIVIFVLKIII